MEGVKMVLEYQVVTRSDKNASDSLKHVREKIKARGRRQLWIQITAVASVVILFALSFAFFYMPELERESPVSAKVHAGGMKATLIVANGIQVDLMQDNLQDVVRQPWLLPRKDKNEWNRKKQFAFCSSRKKQTPPAQYPLHHLHQKQTEKHTRTMPDNNYQKAYSDRPHFLPPVRVQFPIRYIPY